MDLFVNTWGANLEVKNGLFEIVQETDNQTFAPDLVSQIFMASAGSISTDAILLALKYNIDIVLMNRGGRVLGRFWHGTPESTAEIRRNQALFSNHPSAAEWIVQLLHAKAKRQKTVLKLFGNRLYAGVPKALYRKYQDAVKKLIWDTDMQPDTIRGFEGNISKSYFRLVNELIPHDFQFKSRNRRPARDPFNALLNYFYGILYAQVELAVRKAGLDPYLGIFHANGYNSLSFVFDFIEPYRPWADLMAIQLILNSKINTSHFDHPKPGKVWLNEDGKAVAVPAFNEMLYKPVPFKSKNISRIQVLEADAHAFAQMLLKKF